MADKNKKPGIWQTLERFVLMGHVSERRLAALEDRIARFDGGRDADASIIAAVNAENAENADLCRRHGLIATKIDVRDVARG